MQDQCPSTVHGEKAKPGKNELATLRRNVGTVNGLPVWRSLDELADTQEFREHLEKEFPHGALEMQRAFEAGGETRRDFLKIMGGSLALAGVAAMPGCRRPDHKILSYSREVPEDIVIGKPLYYATSMPRPDGGAEGLLVETHEGRPTKIEGNPLHPTSNGKASAWAIASLMGLYDPDRLKFPIYDNPARGKVEATWDDFRTFASTHFAKYDASKGAGLGFIVGKASSPSLEAAQASIMKKYPVATWAWYAPVEETAALDGAALAFGQPMRESLALTKDNTRIILSLDRDFLYHEHGELANARGFARTREVWSETDDMSRLYVVESGFSTTGAQADHRVRLAPSRIAAFAVEIGKYILGKTGGQNEKSLAAAVAAVTVPAGDDLSKESNRRILEECAMDLLRPENRGKALVLAGHTQPAAVHALCYAINAALGSLGNAQTFHPVTAHEAANSAKQLAALVDKANKGEISTLVVVDANPAYDAPGDLDFPAAMKKIATTITLSVGQSETASASTWALNGTHFLESWGDTRAVDGTISPIQPMIAPLYDTQGEKTILSNIEFLALLAGKDMMAKVDGYEIVRSQWSTTLGEANFDNRWRRALHDGVVAGSGQKAKTPALAFDKVATALSTLTLGAAPTAQSLDAAFIIGHVSDGRYANLAWLHELPEVGTRTVWDNPALLSPKTAEELGLVPGYFSRKDPSNIYTKPTYPQGQLSELTIDGRKVTIPVWILPGMADNTVLLTVGYGRTVTGKVGDGVGVNVYPLRSSASVAQGGRMVKAATMSGSKGEYQIVSTQNQWSMEGRTSLVRAVDLPAWRKHGKETQKVVDSFYGTTSELNFGERLGEKSHQPPILSIYKNPYNDGLAAAEPNSVFATGMQWAMTIDQNTCTGCGVCTIACQSENNIPVVGKKETAKGREMTWIRVDRYFTGDFDDPQNMFHQPVACVHCENAPCEVVCPVNATVHGPEGLNYMTYNRCIGTRYCANNCPYKVRRYNFFEYGKLAFNGDYAGSETIDKIGSLIPGQGVGPNGSPEHNKINVNFIPPRLRDKISQIEQMQKNPNVTVRMRGVMEKCSYCIQRINEARIETKLQGLPGIPDGFFQTACQQACPSNSIVFGDMLDKASKVHATKSNARSYALLGYLNTRPRTSHMVRVMNPNENLVTASRKHSWEDPFHHPEDHGHEEGGSDHGDHSHGEDNKPHAFIDSRKRTQDDGYALSLKVLS